MLIDLSEIVKKTGSMRQVESILEMESFQSRTGSFPLTEKSPLVLTIVNRDGKEIEISGDVGFVALIGCDRCLTEVRTPIHFSIDKHLRVIDDEAGKRLVDEEMEETDYLNGFELDVERLAYTEILVNWPMKVLCRDDCKGICRVCGKDLNKGACNCRRTELDPRMAAIQDVFQQFKEV